MSARTAAGRTGAGHASAAVGPDDPVLVVMAKAPVAGYAKTRLAPALGAEGAARLALGFLQAALTHALAATAGPVVLSCAPDAAHPAFASWRGHARIRLQDQAGGDLGERMATAIEQAFERPAASAAWHSQALDQAPLPERVLLFGTDAPALDTTVLLAADAALRQHDAVFVPTLDGGFVLAGFNRAQRPHLRTIFAPLPWSTPQVMPLTRQRLSALGLRVAELPALADIDEPADLVHLGAAWRAGPV